MTCQTLTRILVVPGIIRSRQSAPPTTAAVAAIQAKDPEARFSGNACHSLAMSPVGQTFLFAAGA